MIVYTALFGGYDKLRSTPYTDVEHYLFTENPEPVRGWNVNLVERQFDNPARDNRYYKLQPQRFFSGETVFYHDAGTIPRVHPQRILDWMIKQTEPGADMYALGHPLRNTLPMEIALVRERGIVDDGILKHLTERYSKTPQDRVGIEARLFVAMPSSKPLFDIWWEEVRDHSPRDQIPYHYALHESGVNVATVPLPKARHLFNIYPHSIKHPRGTR
ncbi:MAG: hypothetical protein LC650_04960 [Actinobacteria bacterium]|nr:hypothetical protein [Actinomycetota bacterium]